MLANNNERLNIWLSCKNPFDYDEFCAASTAKNVQLMTAFAFTDKVGIITCAKVQFPEIDHAEAAKAFLAKYQDQVIMIPLPDISLPSPVQVPAPGAVVKTGCCGGKSASLESRGLGDTIYKITHATGLDKLAELYTKITGKPCGCAERQEALNKLLPYGIKED